jgi:hypothetical protein
MSDRLKSTITHKELLTFTNLTNLEWQFVDLKGELVKKKNGDKNTINDLLKPELFAKRDEDGNIREYVYGADNEGNYIGDEQGKIDLRKTSGISMEYLEKWQESQLKEASFIQDWEVIYGGDNYKVVTEFLGFA